MFDDDEDPEPDPASTLALIVAAELLRVKLFDNLNIASMAGRLREAGLDDYAARMESLPLSNYFTDSREVRKLFGVIDGGGNPEDDEA